LKPLAGKKEKGAKGKGGKGNEFAPSFPLPVIRL